MFNNEKRGNRGDKFFKRKEKEFNEKNLDIRRVARVVSGGKRFSFRCTLVIGDGKNGVGIGVGKGLDVANSIDKARNDAKKHFFKVKLKETAIPHEVFAKFSAAKVIIKPAKKGHGLKAGGAVRTVLLMAGIQDATAKCLGKTKNKLTNALATLEALKQIQS